MDNLTKGISGIVAIGVAAVAGRIIYLKGRADAIRDLQELELCSPEETDTDEEIEE